jgi:hypothetical protein
MRKEGKTLQQDAKKKNIHFFEKKTLKFRKFHLPLPPNLQGGAQFPTGGNSPRLA